MTAICGAAASAIGSAAAKAEPDTSARGRVGRAWKVRRKSRPRPRRPTSRWRTPRRSEKGGAAESLLAPFREIGDQPPMTAASATILACGLAFRDRRMARAGVRMLAALGLATLLKSAIKNNIDRTRPGEVMKNGRYRLERGDSKAKELRSMPSGHSAGACRGLSRRGPRLSVRQHTADGRRRGHCRGPAANAQSLRQRHRGRLRDRAGVGMDRIGSGGSAGPGLRRPRGLGPASLLCYIPCA